MDFVEALKQGSLSDIRKCPKADLHNHFVLGGSRSYLKEHSGRDIRPITKPLHSMDEMHAWNAQNIGDYFTGICNFHNQYPYFFRASSRS